MWSWDYGKKLFHLENNSVINLSRDTFTAIYIIFNYFLHGMLYYFIHFLIAAVRMNLTACDTKFFRTIKI